MKETELFALIKKNLPHVHWQRVENSVGSNGVPDVNGCYKGSEFWLELKIDRGEILLRPSQFSWITNGTNHGRRIYLVSRVEGEKEIRIIQPHFYHVERKTFEGCAYIIVKDPPIMTLRAPFRWDSMLNLFAGQLDSR